MTIPDALFAHLCGHVHNWPIALPFCERCTGLYVGAPIATFAFVLFRVRPTARMLWLHGAMLLAMIPFGYHLVPQNADIRTITGQVFAAGLLFFLLSHPVAQFGWSDRHHPAAYLLTVVAAIPALLAALHFGGEQTAMVLGYAGVLGFALYAALAILNLALLIAPIFFSKPVQSP